MTIFPQCLPDLSALMKNFLYTGQEAEVSNTYLPKDSRGKKVCQFSNNTTILPNHIFACTKKNILYMPKTQTGALEYIEAGILPHSGKN
jgi:hypothetical protein